MFGEHPDSAPDLDLVLRLLYAEEKSRLGLQKFQSGHKPEVQLVIKEKKSEGPRRDTSSGEPLKCRSCGRNGHKSFSKECPAKDKTCNFCDKKGHFDTCCWEKNPQMKPKFPPKSFKKKRTNIVKLGAIGCHGKRDLMFKPVFQIGENKAKIEIATDCGSDVTILNLEALKAAFPKVQIRKTRDHLTHYDDGTIRGLQGTVMAKIMYDGNTAETEVYVVKGRKSVIGKFQMQDLRIQYDWDAFTVLSVNKIPDIKTQFPKLFSSEGG